MKGRVAWAVFAFGVVVAAGALAWVSAALLALERANVQAGARAIADETTRAAMWQFESELSPLVADQASRPYFHYASFYPVEGAYDAMFEPVGPGVALYPSPLIRLEPGDVRLHFQFAPDGTLTSPQAPLGDMRLVARRRNLAGQGIIHAEERMAHLASTVTRAELLSRLPTRTRSAADEVSPEMVFADEAWQARIQGQSEEYQQRSQATKQAATQLQANAWRNSQEITAPTGVREGPMTALWMGETLLLARRISIHGNEYVQGCVLDWAGIHDRLQSLADTVLPGARFQAVTDGAVIEKPDALRLASLPIEVLPGEPSVAAGGWSPIRSALYAAWACMAAVALSLAFVLGRTLSLAARREEFVSAVTHELRTPLTTFRMYTELLQSGRVTDETARHEYYNTLHAEALRLGHLVENVLAYARLENRDNAERMQALSLSSLLERATERLARRTAQSGTQVQIAPCADVRVRADPVAVEQILFNLVDNACKHGRGPVSIDCEASNRRAIISVSDHGPGIKSHEAARLFKPFRKSAQQAADSAPGVGLGLALSRRLARAMGGELSLDTTNKEGTRFLLKLPLVEGN